MMIQLTKIADGEPVSIAADQVVRVHGRRGDKGRLFCELYVRDCRRPIGVTERHDQVMTALAAAGVHATAAGSPGPSGAVCASPAVGTAENGDRHTL